MATCYRHPSRETAVSCSNCERPICPDCMTPTQVGMRCPECASERTRVHTMRSLSLSGTDVTRALIAINVILFLLSGSFGLTSGASSSLVVHAGLFGPAVADQHEYWRIVTGGFLHANLIHIFFNMYLLYVLGGLLEPALGAVRFGAIYAVALLAGSFGSLLAAPNELTIGASGAVFGLMGAAFVEMRARGVDPMRSGIGPLILINLALSFGFAGISVGGHVGGLVGGVLATLALQFGDRVRTRGLGLSACALLAAVSFAGAIAVAGG